MSSFKKTKPTTSLVIVESPAKCKKIEQYLGPGYKCLASFGHLRQLKSLKNIDIENEVFLATINIKNIDMLKEAIQKSGTSIVIHYNKKGSIK